MPSLTIIKHKFLIFIFFHLFALSEISAEEVINPPSPSNSIQSSDDNCKEVADRETLRNGWYLWEPYQFNKATVGGYKLVGMDVELVKNLAQRLGIVIEYEQLPWKQHQEDLKEGNRDIAAGATYTDARAEYVYFSVPYRYEENSLFVMNNSDKELNFSSISEFLAQIRIQNFKLGVTKGFIYADPQINTFIRDETNNDIIIEYEEDVGALLGLTRAEIDGFIADRVVGAAAILNQKVNAQIEEVPLNIKTPIHLMFSKKTVPIALVEKFNNEIKNFSNSKDYKKIVKTYLYPVMLMQTIDSQWFYVIGVLGTIAFAISGIAIAAKDNSTLLSTFVFAMLPSVGGVVIRDVLTNRDEVGIFLTPSYMYYILIVVLVGFSLVRLLEYYNQGANEDQRVNKFWNNVLTIGDAVGQSAFIVTGVAIVIMAKIEPLELWGPFLAFLTANGGGIFRDLLRKQGKITCLSGRGINAEVGILWSLIFSIYLDINSYNPNPTAIRNMVIIIVIGCFLTRLLVYYLKIPNIQFRPDKETETMDT